MTRSPISSPPFELNYRSLLIKSGLKNRPPEKLPSFWAPNSTGPFDFSPDSDPSSPTPSSSSLSALPWTPLPGPQTAALETMADELYYGGGAGGGKSDLLLGYGLTRARHGIIFRRQFKQLLGPEALIERSKAISGRPELFNNSQNVWRLGGRVLEFGAVDHEDDRVKYQGRAHDFKGFDELPQFSESQYLYLIGWARTSVPGQRVRVIAAGNPPQSTEGEWVIQRWAAWLDEQHPNPARPGELRWYVRTRQGEEVEVESGAPVTIDGELLHPKSRTFIPARVQDNPFLMATDYLSQLQQFPEPLRSQLIFGDHAVGLQDDEWQVIPAAWVRQAQERWSVDGRPKDDEDVPLPLSAIGADVAQGGGDRTVLARRCRSWFAELEVIPGSETPDANVNAAVVLRALTDGGYANIDANGIGASTYFLAHATVKDRVRAYLGSDSTTTKDKSGTLEFLNVRAAAHWAFREALDPQNGDNIALPPDRELRAELCAPRWALQANGIKIEAKDDIKKRLGRSPDKADAVVMAWWSDPHALLAGAFRSAMAPRDDAAQPERKLPDRAYEQRGSPRRVERRTGGRWG